MKNVDERIIVKNLLTNSSYFLKVFPFIKEDLFEDRTMKKFFRCIQAYNERYSRQPTVPVMSLFVDKLREVSEDEYSQAVEDLSYFRTEESYDTEWLSDVTQDWIRSRSFYNAVFNAAEKYENGELDTELPEKIQESLSVSFESKIGMEFADAEERWEAYSSPTAKLPFLLESMNMITAGGTEPGTLHGFMSSRTGGFKTGFMCSLAADYLRQNKNVLYITMEMSEKKILERIDANLLDTAIDDLVKLGKDFYCSGIKKILSKTTGRLFVKQFPTSIGNTNHVRYILKKLKLEKGIVPEIVFWDYAGIMASSRLKPESPEHLILKAVTEEIRGLSVEEGFHSWTGLQSNRGGLNAGESLDVDSVASSYGSAYGFDMLLGLITTPEFDADKKMMVKQFKNRYTDWNINNKFFVGIDKPKMRVYDLFDSPRNMDDVAGKAKEEEFAEAFNKNKKFAGFNFGS